MRKPSTDMLESKIQEKVVEYAKKCGFRPFKRSMWGAFGRSGDPDYEFNGEFFVTFFIEFKRRGRKSTTIQKQRQKELLDLGYPVQRIDNIEVGKSFVDAMVGLRELRRHTLAKLWS